MNIVIIGLSITSSWGNGHATTYRGLVRELNKRGHNIVFYEQDAEWYANNRDMTNPEFCKTVLYKDINELKELSSNPVKDAELVIVGSYVKDGVEAGKFVTETAGGVTAFYDIDTPVTLAKLERKDYEYISPELIEKYNMYLSFTGGPTLTKLEEEFGSPMAKALYCSFDPELYSPMDVEKSWDLGYLGTYSPDRQPPLNELMLKAAAQFTEGKFVVAGPQYPEDIVWGENVKRIHHLAPYQHREFYNRQRFTLNITRADMIKAGYSPSVRLFEAAACGVPIISDSWKGLDTIFSEGTEILIARSFQDTLKYLKEIPELEAEEIGMGARERVLKNHTAAHRAIELENYYNECIADLKL